VGKPLHLESTKRFPLFHRHDYEVRKFCSSSAEERRRRNNSPTACRKTWW
jgi:hypothetical protein